MPTRRKSAPSNLELVKATPSSSASDAGSQTAEKPTKMHKRSRSGKSTAPWVGPCAQKFQLD